MLEPVLFRLGLFLETSQDLKEYIISAMVYPLFSRTGRREVSITILLTFVIPKFSIIFSDLGAAIPMSTQLLFWGSVLSFGTTGGPSWGESGWSFIRIEDIAVRPRDAFRIDRLKIRMPVVGELVKKDRNGPCFPGRWGH